jgi:hypothetical protein
MESFFGMAATAIRRYTRATITEPTMASLAINAYNHIMVGLFTKQFLFSY